MDELPIVTRLREVALKQKHERGDYLDLGQPDPWLTEASDRITELEAALREVSDWIADPRMTTWMYLKGVQFHRDRVKQMEVMSAALAKAGANQ